MYRVRGSPTVVIERAIAGGLAEGALAKRFTTLFRGRRLDLDSIAMRLTMRRVDQATG
jgi:hypothetical protein